MVTKLKNPKNIFTQLGVAGLDLKVGQKYTVKVELVAKKVGGMNTPFIHLKTCSTWPDENTENTGWLIG